MKKFILIIICFYSFDLLAQKEKNGTVYKEHPGIVLVETLEKAIVDGDIEKLSSMLDDDFRIRNGTGLNKDFEGWNKQQFINNAKWWSSDFDYLSITRDKPAYPDAIEYKESGIWVQTWERLYAVNKTTGVKVDMPFHRLYRLNKDSDKVLGIFEYNNQNVFNASGTMFNTPFNLKWKNDLNIFGNSKFIIKFNEINIAIKNNLRKKILKNNFQYEGSQTLNFIGSEIKTNYKFNNKLLSFQSEDSKINSKPVSLYGTINFRPFFFDIQVDLRNADLFKFIL